MSTASCPLHPHRPADIAYGGTCSVQCEMTLAARRQRVTHASHRPMPRLPYKRERCPCGGELHPRHEAGSVVIRCLRCRASETISPLVVQHLS